MSDQDEISGTDYSPQTRWRLLDDAGVDYGTFTSHAKAARFAEALLETDRQPPVESVRIIREEAAHV